VRPRHLADVEELVVPSSDDAVLVLVAVAAASNALGEEPSRAGRERAGLALVGVVGHLPAREDARLDLVVGAGELDRVLGRPQEVLERLARVLALGGRCDGLALALVLERELVEAGRGRARVGRAVLLLRALAGGPGGVATGGDVLLLVVEAGLVLSGVVLAKVLELADELGGGRGFWCGFLVARCHHAGCRARRWWESGGVRARRASWR